MKLKRKIDLPLTSMNRTTYSLALSSASSSIWPSLFPSFSFFPCCSEYLYLILQAEKFFLHFKHAYLLCSKDKAEFKFGGVCSIWLFSSDKNQSILLWSHNSTSVSPFTGRVWLFSTFVLISLQNLKLIG